MTATTERDSRWMAKLRSKCPKDISLDNDGAHLFSRLRQRSKLKAISFLCLPFTFSRANINSAPIKPRYAARSHGCILLRRENRVLLYSEKKYFFASSLHLPSLLTSKSLIKFYLSHHILRDVVVIFIREQGRANFSSRLYPFIRPRLM